MPSENRPGGRPANPRRSLSPGRRNDRVQPPERVLRPIAERATEIAAQKAPKRTGAGARALEPIARQGSYGIRVPPSHKYMLYQNYGFDSFVMWHLAGKVIPIRGEDGTIHFRTATLENIGRRRITARDERGRIQQTRLSWWHPGLEPKWFLEEGIQQAYREWVASAEARPGQILDVLRANPVTRDFLREARNV